MHNSSQGYTSLAAQTALLGRSNKKSVLGCETKSLLCDIYSNCYEHRLGGGLVPQDCVNYTNSPTTITPQSSLYIAVGYMTTLTINYHWDLS